MIHSTAKPRFVRQFHIASPLQATISLVQAAEWKENTSLSRLIGISKAAERRLVGFNWIIQSGLTTEPTVQAVAKPFL